jgi:hypothetical protein
MRALEAFVQEGGVLIAEGTPAAIFPDYRLVPGISVERPTALWAPGSVMKTLVGDRTSPILYGYDQKALAVLYRDGPLFALGGVGAGRGGGRGGFTPPAQPNLQPMATPSRLTTLDGPPLAAAAGEGRGGRADSAFAAGAMPVANPPRVLLSYPSDANDLLLSGALVGGEALAGHPALVDARLGKGHVVLFGFRPFWRFETQGSFFLAFNAILNWNHLDAGRSGT